MSTIFDHSRICHAYDVTNAKLSALKMLLRDLNLILLQDPNSCSIAHV
jgi:hypothetical protein